LAECYSDLLSGIEELILPTVQPNRIHSWHLFVIRLKLSRLSIDRAQLIEELKAAGIGTSVHWMPLHMHPYYRETYGYKPEDLPQAARLYPEIISLPIYPEMSLKDILHVCAQLKRIIVKHRKFLVRIPVRTQIPARPVLQAAV
jgi:dTDP-4-amino-4,6-dideoxygalactose transaminase